MTPKHAWEDIKHIIPKDKVIWEAFYGDGKSGEYLTELGFKTIHKCVDFFENDYGDIVVSNPPFSKTKEVFERLVELNKPFIIILPSSKINTQYVRKLFLKQKDKLQIIIPRKRIHFEKKIDGKTPEGWRNACNFDCFYYCWKIGLESDMVWLGDDEDENLSVKTI
jgi:hypothetical protein